MMPPTSGCARVSRSSAASSCPATSIITGPRGCSLAMISSFQDDECRGHAALVGEADMHAVHASLPDELRERVGKLEVRPPGRMVHDPDVLPADWVPNSGPQCFRKCLLSREALS